jgi:hemin uptake protein HemP
MTDDRTRPPGGQPFAGTTATTASARREITSAELFAGRREINIRHGDEIYTLRQTSKGKLILTK